MLTQRIDAALDALETFRRRLPDLAACFPAGTPTRNALEAALSAAREAEVSLFAPTSLRAPATGGMAEEAAVFSSVADEGARS